MFSDLPEEFQGLLSAASKSDHLCVFSHYVHILVFTHSIRVLIGYIAEIETYMRKYSQDSEYLSELLSKSVLYPSKLLFETFIVSLFPSPFPHCSYFPQQDQEVESIKAIQPSIKRCGVLPIVFKVPVRDPALISSLMPSQGILIVIGLECTRRK